MVKFEFYEQLYDVEFVEPKMIKAKLNPTDQDFSYFELSKSVLKYFYGKEGILDLPLRASEALFENISIEAWNENINERLMSKAFNFDDYQFILVSGMVLEIIKKNENVSIEEMKENYEKLINKLTTIEDKKELFDLDNYFEKTLIKCNKDEKFTNVITIEMDYRNSRYSLTAGIETEKLLWFHTTKNLEEKNLVDFLLKINLDDEINLANKFGQALYKDYEFDLNSKNLDETLSLGELFSILKQVNIGIMYEEDKKSEEYGRVVGLKYIDEGSIIGSDIIDSINSYDIPFRALKRLLSLEKSFKDGKIKFITMLQFMYQEYFNINIEITSSNIISIRNKITKRKNDSNIIQKEIKNLE